MWNIINKTPFATGHLFAQDDKKGEMIWMVAVKATYDISPEDGKLTIADEQEKINPMEEFRGDPAKSSLLWPGDFSLNKPNVDLLLNATAYAPKGEEVSDLEVAFELGEISKTLRVVGDREYQRALGMIVSSAPVMFNKKEINYENAFGGWQDTEDEENVFYETRNPAGRGYSPEKRFLVGQDLPNIEYPDSPTRKKPKKNRVAGFGPIAGTWEPRMSYVGTISEEKKGDNIKIRPKDFNPLYYQTAPEDQQLKVVSGGEEVNLYNLHPEHPILRFRLPQVELKLETLLDEAFIKHSAKLQTIIIESCALKLQMLWQGSLECPHLGRTLEFTKVTHNIVT